MDINNGLGRKDETFKMDGVHFTIHKTPLGIYELYLNGVGLWGLYGSAARAKEDVRNTELGVMKIKQIWKLNNNK